MTDTKNLPRQIPAKSADQSLDQYLTGLIAQQDHVPASNVTVSYIREQREKRIYDRVRFDKGSQYGGYTTKGLRFRNRRELDELQQRVDAQLAKARSS